MIQQFNKNKIEVNGQKHRRARARVRTSERVRACSPTRHSGLIKASVVMTSAH